MQNLTGQVAEAENFFDRTTEISRFWQGLETDNLLLLAPRRVGKTSVLRRMKATAAQHGFTAIYIDVSDCADELRFVQRLYAEILEHHAAAERLWNGITESWLGKTISRVKKVGVPVFSVEFSDNDETRWARMGEELAESLQGLEGKTLIQIDELPLFALKLLNNGEDARQTRIREFLYWMRRIRLQYPHVRWMLAGSIGLDTVAARLNIADSINDLHLETLGAFDEATSHKLLLALGRAYKIDLDEPVRSRILQRVGWLVPFYLQLIFHQLRQHPVKPEPADVDNAVDTLLNASHRNTFDFWRQRLHDELGNPDSNHAILLLNAACRSANGVRRTLLKQVLAPVISDAAVREDKLRYLLDVLETDGYLVEQSNIWHFRSPLLREFWLRRVAPPESDE